MTLRVPPESRDRSSGVQAPAGRPLEGNPMYPPACIHGDGQSLCQSCREQYEYDAESYIEVGDHPEGLARWREIQEGIAADAERARNEPPSEPDPNIPF